MSTHDPFGARDVISTPQGSLGIYRLSALEQRGLGPLDRLPYCIRVLLESALRNCDGFTITEQDVRTIASWGTEEQQAEIPFKPARVILQDFTGVPAVVDLAAMRSAMKRLGGDPKRINPLIPVDLVIDHSIQVDVFGTPDALERNIELEFQRNRERYEFLKWGQQAFENFRVVPPGVGIVHQVNLEFLAQGVLVGKDSLGAVAYPDSLVGTDSHTTMINGLGIVGWGVGGIEAEAVMLGQPIYMLLPEVIGMELVGQLPPGATATDLVLRVTELLRQENVVGKFVEFFGSGVQGMSLPDRATLANMAPEYGATMGFFPMDEESLDYLRRTGRDPDQVELVRIYMQEQGLLATPDRPVPQYSKVLRLDLSTVEPSVAGPKRPQDRVPLRELKSAFKTALSAPVEKRGYGLNSQQLSRSVTVQLDGQAAVLTHGSVVIAAITSCTNTSNPSVMLAAGLLAQKAAARGLKAQGYVKTSLAPGSRVVSDYLEQSGLYEALKQVGFYLVGYGCTTCIGNSGPLPEPVAQAVRAGELVAAAVLSGNRNFEGRVNPLVKANYLASPPLVVAFALAGRVDLDLTREPLATDPHGQPVYLHDLWPQPEEIQQLMQQISPELFRRRYANVFDSNPRWNELPAPTGELYRWDPKSTYIQEPPFLLDLKPEPDPIQPIRQARVLVALGDSVTTDHISPAGAISADSPAGRYLIEQGVDPRDFNSYGSRRGNDRVMTRGTFANPRVRNLIAPGTEGGWTTDWTDGQVKTIYEAAMNYRRQGIPLVVLAGRDYGMGSSRDWAAKGTYLLGIKAVLAQSFERIHRSNLVGMGVLPLQFAEDKNWQQLGLTGREVFDIPVDDQLQPRQQLIVTATDPESGKTTPIPVVVRIDTPVELEYYRNGGILQTVLRKLAREGAVA